MDNKKFVEVIYALAREKKMKMKDVEKQLGVTVGYLRSIERNIGIRPGIDLFINASNLFNVSIDYLVGNNRKQEFMDDEELLIEYLEQLILMTRTNEIEWEEETWKTTKRKCYLNGSYVCNDSINPRVDVNIDEDEICYPYYKVVNDTGRRRYVDVTYQSTIPNNDIKITFVLTSYESDDDLPFVSYDTSFDIFLGETDIQDVMIGGDWLYKEETLVYLSAKKLLECIQEQVRMRSCFLTKDVRDILKKQIRSLRGGSNVYKEEV